MSDMLPLKAIPILFCFLLMVAGQLLNETTPENVTTTECPTVFRFAGLSLSDGLVSSWRVICRPDSVFPDKEGGLDKDALGGILYQRMINVQTRRCQPGYRIVNGVCRKAAFMR
ncbi:unnamed protein product [Nezara viridula]|uniref:Neuropeptide n=1 Tax=Nezara viridula TaxID=85310 RepID=A0A9P0HNS4_NEZVI|nr:unnamed protein product [Nezara viridula]